MCQTSLAISPLKHRYQERHLVQLQLTILLTIRRSRLFTRSCTHCFSGIWGSSRNVCTKGAIFEGRLPGTCLVVQWLRLCAPNAGGLGSIPGWGTIEHVSTKDPKCHNENGTSHVPQLSPSSAKKKKKKRRDGLRPTLRCQKWHGFLLLSTPHPAPLPPSCQLFTCPVLIQ